MTKLHELAGLGQSVWLDYISRPLIVSGELQKLVERGLRGVTSNRTIFEQAIAGSTDYDEDLKRLGIDFDAITKQVLENGVKSFAKSFDALLDSIAEKQERFLQNMQQLSAGFGPTS